MFFVSVTSFVNSIYSASEKELSWLIDDTDFIKGTFKPRSEGDE